MEAVYAEVLARIETNDILAYIKAQLPITGITVHEGKTSVSDGTGQTT